MKISELLKPEVVILNLEAKNKEEVIEKMLEILIKARKLDKKNKYNPGGT